MATDESAFDRILARSAAEVPDGYSPPSKGDWGRRARDAFIANRSISARMLSSAGDLRLHGVGVEMNTADLQAVGAIATAWQKAVSAVGGALEEIKSIRGALPTDVVQRTSLVLNASPQPGSVVLHIEPKSRALDEVEPDGDAQLIDPPRPLADRASEGLIQLLTSAAEANPNDFEDLSATMSRLGPRVSGAVASLAQALTRANITLDASWDEPSRNSVRTSVDPSQAMWISAFVAGRGLDAEIIPMRGVLRTVSDRERWLVEVGDEAIHMSAGELDPIVVARWNIGDEVDVMVRVAQTERPDGTTTTKHTLVSVHEPAEE